MKAISVLLILALVVLASWASCSRNGHFAGRPEGALGIDGERTEVEATLPPGLVRVQGEESLPRLPTEAERAQGLALFRDARTRAAQGDRFEAALLLGEGARVLPLMGDWAALLRARAHAAAGDGASMEAELQRIREGGAVHWAWRTRYDFALEQGDSVRAIEIAEAAAPMLPLPEQRALAWSHAGSVRWARHDEAGALADWREAMRSGTGTAGALAAARSAAAAPSLPLEDRLLTGRVLLAHGVLDRGVSLLGEYAAAAPAPLAAELHFEAGRYLFNARRYDDAEAHLQIAAVHDPAAALLHARTLYRQGRTARGIEHLIEVARNHPGSPAASDALFMLGDLAHDEGRIEVARDYYRQSVATGAHTIAASDAAMRLAGIALIGGDAARAEQELTLYLASRPRDARAVPGIYWLGRTRAERGDRQEAERSFREVTELDPISYYGMLAAERLGTSLGAMPLAPPPEAAPELVGAIELEFFRIDLLQELGLREEADLELAQLQALLAREPAALYPVAEALARHGRPGAGALLGRRLQQEGQPWDERLLRIVYPFPYQELVLQAAQRHSLDPYIVAGLIRQESLFDPLATSPAGAIGLMQLMPGTASGLARRGGIGNFETAMLRDPATNLHLGTIFLADQTARWEGRASDVFAAYNAGPNRVVRWRAFPEHRDDEIYVERIPLAETRDYVKRVRLNRELYRRLYGGSLP